MFTCLLIIIVHADHHTWEIIIIVFCKQSLNLLAEPSLSIIPCYAFSSMWEKAASYDRIVRTLCFGGFCNTSWMKLWSNFKETKQIAKIVVATIHGAWVFLLSLVYPSKNVILLLGSPRLPDRLCSPTDLPEVRWFSIFFIQNPEREVIKKKKKKPDNHPITMVSPTPTCSLHAMDWPICIGEMVCCP